MNNVSLSDELLLPLDLFVVGTDQNGRRQFGPRVQFPALSHRDPKDASFFDQLPDGQEFFSAQGSALIGVLQDLLFVAALRLADLDRGRQRHPSQFDRIDQPRFALVE